MHHQNQYDEDPRNDSLEQITIIKSDANRDSSEECNNENIEQNHEKTHCLKQEQDKTEVSRTKIDEKMILYSEEAAEAYLAAVPIETITDNSNTQIVNHQILITTSEASNNTNDEDRENNQEYESKEFIDEKKFVLAINLPIQNEPICQTKLEYSHVNLAAASDELIVESISTQTGSHEYQSLEDINLLSTREENIKEELTDESIVEKNLQQSTNNENQFIKIKDETISASIEEEIRNLEEFSNELDAEKDLKLPTDNQNPPIKNEIISDSINESTGTFKRFSIETDDKNSFSNPPFVQNEEYKIATIDYNGSILSEGVDFEINNGLFQCIYCQKSKKHKRNLDKHIIDHVKNLSVYERFYSPNALFEGSFINFGSTFIKSIDYQIIILKNNEFYQCLKCQKTYNTSYEMGVHLSEHRGKHKFRCIICKKLFPDFNDLKCHRKIIHFRKEGNWNFRCNKEGCSWKYSNLKDVMECGFTHNSSAKLECRVCKISFKNKISLNRHNIVVHSAYLKLSCHICSSYFLTKLALIKHLFEVHNVDETSYSTISKKGNIFKKDIDYKFSDGLFKCLKCDLEGRTARKMANHLFLALKFGHKNEKEFKCSRCSESFLTSGKLNVHRKEIHQEETRDYTCPGCNNSFTTKIAQIECEQSHAGIFKYKCEVCAMPFAHNSNLYAHKMREHKIKKFTCTICEKQLSSSPMLRLHMRTQHGDKSREVFTCDVCGKCYYIKSSLRKHKYDKHSTMLVQCSVCGKTFSGLNNLRFHEKTHSKKNLKIESKTQTSLDWSSNEVRANKVVKRDGFTFNEGVDFKFANSTYQCLTCTKSTQNDIDMGYHLAEHAKNLLEYERLYSPNALFEESFINFGSTFVKSIDYQIITEKNHEFYQCLKCEVSYNSRYEMGSHLSEHRCKNKFRCIICKSLFPGYNDLKAHRKLIYLNKMANWHFRCHEKTCRWKYSNLKDANECELTHKNTSQLKCRDCTMPFENKISLNRHNIVVHSAHMKESCHICSSFFFNKQSLTKHLSETHNVNETSNIAIARSGNIFKLDVHYTLSNGLFKCLKCALESGTDQGMAKHLLSHKNKKEFKCSHCSKYFLTGGQLNLHRKKIHKEETRDYKCLGCTNSFTTKIAQMECEQSHAGIFKYKCEICGMKFPHNSNFYTHKIREHTKKQFKCTICEKELSSTTMLHLHMKTQHDDKRSEVFTCDDCGNCFYSESSLRKHKYDKHGTTQVQCTVCGKTFSGFRYLRDHEKIHSKNQNIEASLNRDSNEFETEKIVIRTHTERKKTVRHSNAQGNYVLDCDGFTFNEGVNFEFANKSYKCLTCSKSITREIYMGPHLAEHEKNLSVYERHYSPNGLFEGSFINFGSTFVKSIDYQIIAERNHEFYQCLKCQKTFSTSFFMGSHLSEHLGKNLFKCIICKKLLPDLKELEDHKQTTHIETDEKIWIFQCLKCTKRFTNLKDAKECELTHENKPIKCRSCLISFENVISYRRHRIIVHSEHTQNPCHLCSNNFQNKLALEEHLVEAHNMKEASKTITFKDYTFEESIDYEVIDLIYHCVKCKLSFRSGNKMGKHLVTHYTGKDFKCHHCGELFHTPGKLNIHRRTIHNDKALDFKCQGCTKAFSTKIAATQCEQSHVGILKYKCKICPMAFENIRLLSKHNDIIHKGNRPSCTVCGKEFLFTNQLVQHLKTHETVHETEMLECTDCGRSYKNYESLRGHKQRVHTIQRKVVCPICGKTFTAQALKLHALKHSDIRAFDCTICDRKFKYKKYLKYHINAVHLRLKPHVCKSCGEKFTQPNGLRKHMKKHHDESL